MFLDRGLCSSLSTIDKVGFKWWVSNNRPRHGPIYHSMRSALAQFKCALLANEKYSGLNSESLKHANPLLCLLVLRACLHILKCHLL